MRTVMLGSMPAHVAALVERRRSLGIDLHDEVWEGDYHMAPAPHPWHGYLDDEIAAALRPVARRVGLYGTGPFNLGGPDDYRVPDRGLQRTLPATTFASTAALVVEIVSPDDETWAKLDFYAGHRVDELVIVDPTQRSVTWLALEEDRYVEVRTSALLGVSADEVIRDISWPGDG